MRKVIVNSTPLIVLCNIGELDILRSMYGEITIPKAVYDEVTVKEDTACSILKDSPDWIHIYCWGVAWVDETIDCVPEYMYEHSYEYTAIA